MGDPQRILPGFADAAPSAASAHTAAEFDRARARSGRTYEALLAEGVGVDPDYARTRERFEAWSHEQIHDAVHGPAGMDVARLQAARQAWFDAYAQLSRSATFHLLGIERLLSRGAWAGASGDAARAASTAFGRSADLVAQVFAATADRLDALAWAAEATRLAVPAPAGTPPADPDDPASHILPGLPNPATSTAEREAAERARLDAVAAMNNIYKPGFPPNGSGVPAFPAVPASGTDRRGGTASAAAALPGRTAAPDSRRPTAATPGSAAPTEDTGAVA
ncbi:hypothetical protein ACFYTF_26680 [Nocardia thailandica]|uniref:PPE family domain-containing protein n=1 Tax=Nocardia thailandica TaxID=257275 RepID=A0ABW6PVG7_9NOCA